MNDVSSLLSLAVSIGTVLLLVPVYGKVFFSRHSVEYRPIEEIAQIRSALGGVEKTGVEEAAEHAAHLTGRLFGRPDEKLDELYEFRPHKRPGNEKRPVPGDETGDEPRAHVDQDRH